mgnify:CR=1 FL=1
MTPASITCSDGKLDVPNNPIIPVIVGDGIGQDVTPVAMKVLDAAAVSYTHLTLPTILLV